MKPITRPALVKWGGIAYEVQWVEGMRDRTSTCGSTDSVGMVISIDPAADWVGTFIHENVHACAYMLGEDPTEKQVISIEHAVRAFIADNPSTVRELCDAIESEVETHGPKRNHKSRR